MIVIIRPSILSEVRGIDILAGRCKGRLVELIFTVTHHSQKDRKLSISYYHTSKVWYDTATIL